jgi:lipopolysaccharide export system permease protein
LLPSLLTRYVILELAKIFVVSSIGFVGLMVIVGLAEEAAEHGLGPDIILKISPYVIPKALMFAMPATCLFSACVVFGRLSADNELIAVEALGLPKSVLVMPALVLAFLISLFAVWVNDISFAWSYWGVERVVLESSDRIAYSVLQNEGGYSTERFSIEVDGVENRRLIHPVITFRNSNKGDYRIVAHEAVLESHPETHSLNFTITKGLVDGDGGTSMQFPDSTTIEIPLKTPAEIARSLENPSHLYLSQIKRSIADQKVQLHWQLREDAMQCCSQLLTGDLVGLTNASWTQRMKNEEDAKRRLNRLHVVPHRRWANGFSCLAFVVIGIPVAIRMRTANYATTFGVCFLPILFVYYPLFMFGLNSAKLGTLPPYAAWLGDVACIAIGMLLLYREFRK